MAADKISQHISLFRAQQLSISNLLIECIPFIERIHFAKFVVNSCDFM
jgi:hypothetical protein